MELNCLILMSCVFVLSVTGQSDVIGSREPVHVTVGHDVILPCHLEPSYDVRTLTVEWRHYEVIVHKYRSRADDLVDQDENFRGRTSLFFDELIRGNISLKLTNVTEQDEGNYTCFVPKLDSQVKRGSIKLIVDPEENRNKGNQTDSDQKKNNNNRHHGFIALIIILVILAMVVTVMWRRRVNNNRHAGQGGGRPRDENELVPMVGNVHPDQHAGQDGGEPQEENELIPRDGNIQPGQDEVEPQEEDEEALMEDRHAGQDGGEPHIAGNIQPGRRGKYKPALRTGNIQTDSHVRQRQARILNY